MAMREQQPLLNLLKEIVSHNVDACLKPTMIHCKAFKDNSGALENGQSAQNETSHQNI